MKLDLLLEYRGSLVLIAWARETSLGVYMGVRFSPEVENASYFKDGQRQLLRFPLMPDGKRGREAVLLERRTPIASIEHDELILQRLVDVSNAAGADSPAPKASADTTKITVSEDRLENRRYLYYEAHIVRNGCLEEFCAAKAPDSGIDSDEGTPSIQISSLHHFQQHSLALTVWRKRPFVR